MSLSKFLKNSPKRDIKTTYRAVVGMAYVNETNVVRGEYGRESAVYRFMNAIFIETRKKAIEALGREFVDNTDKSMNYVSRDNTIKALEDFEDKLSEE